MHKRIITICLSLLIVATARGDYILDREEAVSLIDKRQYADAMQKLEAMASADKVTELQKSDALSLATHCAIRLKQDEKALSLIEEIPIQQAQTLELLRMMNNQRQWAEGSAQFADEPFEEYSARYRGDALYLFGRLNFFAKNGKAAEKALLAATQTIPATSRDLPHALLMLAMNYRANLDAPEKAIAVYRKVHEYDNAYRAANAAIDSAEILIAMDKPQEAIHELDKVDISVMKSSHVYPATMLLTRAKALIAMDQNNKAIATLDEALALPKAPERVLEQAREMKQTLSGS